MSMVSGNNPPSHSHAAVKPQATALRGITVATMVARPYSVVESCNV